MCDTWFLRVAAHSCCRQRASRGERGALTWGTSASASSGSAWWAVQTLGTGLSRRTGLWSVSCWAKDQEVAGEKETTPSGPSSLGAGRYGVGAPQQGPGSWSSLAGSFPPEAHPQVTQERRRQAVSHVSPGTSATGAGYRRVYPGRAY